MSERFEMLPENSQPLSHMIYTIRGVQVMLDSDLAALYHVETKVFNQAVKRNVERFPDSFRFQLTAEEFGNLKSQSVTSSRGADANGATHGGRRYMPYVFTEQGVAMLSGVLHSDFAIQTSIRIMNAFVKMRRFIASTSAIFSKLEAVERKQIVDQHENDKKFDLIFQALDHSAESVQQGIFYDGQIYDAYSFVQNLLKKAKNRIVLIDGYVDQSVLDMLSRKNAGVNVTVITHPKTSISALDIAKFNAQYPCLTIKHSTKFHDRFLILDNAELYHIGASIKDLGIRCFGFSQMDAVLIPALLEKL